MSEAGISTKSPHRERDAEQDAAEDSGARLNKLKKRDLDPPMAEVDIKLADRLDRCLKISDTRKARFFMNKPNGLRDSPDREGVSPFKRSDINMGSIKPKNLTREELRERLAKKYDTLVPKLDPKRTTATLVKILSAKESLEMGKEEAKKQLVDQMKLNSISGNQRAFTEGIESFRFNDGYERPSKNFYSKSFDIFQKSKNGLDKRNAANGDEQANEPDKLQRHTCAQPKSGISKRVGFVEEVDVNELSDRVSNPYDFFVPNEDEDENLTDEPEEEDDEPIGGS